MRDRKACFARHIDINIDVRSWIENRSDPFVIVTEEVGKLRDAFSLNSLKNERHDQTLRQSAGELQQDCLCYLQYQRKPVKASRLFSGPEYEEGVKRIADHFNQNSIKYRTIAFNPELASVVQRSGSATADTIVFKEKELSSFVSDEEAYHQLMLDIINQQYLSTQLVLKGTKVKRIFVDGGFSKNIIYMNLLACCFPDIEIFAASMAQATAMGAALAIHSAWNKKSLPNDIIELKYFSSSHCPVL